jgi:hypothetical protein
MEQTDDGRTIRLRPAKPRFARNEGAVWSSGFRLLMRYAGSSRMTRSPTSGGKEKGSRPYHQRCAVRVTYVQNKIRGQWKAHGCYLARESASVTTYPNTAGFSRDTEGIDISQRLEIWQRAGDETIFKLIISPEFGDRVDLTRLTRELIERMEDDLGTGLEWVGVEHHNTEHPHVHVAVRGIKADGRSLRLAREYVQSGIRNIAQDLCTRQLGYRTELDAADAERREVTEKRFTSIDRSLQRRAPPLNWEDEPEYFTVTMNLATSGSSGMTRLHREYEITRLAVLRQMGLAESAGPTVWRVRRDFEPILRAMPRTSEQTKNTSRQRRFIIGCAFAYRIVRRAQCAFSRRSSACPRAG